MEEVFPGCLVKILNPPLEIVFMQLDVEVLGAAFLSYVCSLVFKNQLMIDCNHFSLVCCAGEGFYPIKKSNILQDLKRNTASEYMSYWYSVEVAVQINYVEFLLT